MSYLIMKDNNFMLTYYLCINKQVQSLSKTFNTKYKQTKKLI
jgi:hypothetical protein